MALNNSSMIETKENIITEGVCPVYIRVWTCVSERTLSGGCSCSSFERPSYTVLRRQDHRVSHAISASSQKRDFEFGNTINIHI